MIYLILIYFLLSLTCLLAGHIFYALIPSLKIIETNYKRPLISYLLSGLILLTGLGQWVVLFFPLNLISILGIVIILLILLLFFRKNLSLRLKKTNYIFFQRNILFLTSFVVLLLMILTLNAGPTIMDDTDSYHIQMIKWAQEYGSVPGIANLHLRFGFNSSWFIACALFSPNIKGINSYLALNGLISIWFSYYLLEKIFLGFSKEATQLEVKVSISSIIVLLLCLWAWPLIRGNAATANYDFITTCCIFVLFIETFLSKETGCQQEWLIWPVYLFTIRIINYPVLFLTLIILFRFFKERKIRNLVICCLIFLLIITPFIVRNTILSGYPLFPVYQIDLFSFDWKADKQLIIGIVNYIKYFNRVNIQSQPLAITRQLGFPNWIASWYHFLFIYDKILTTIAMVSSIVVLLIWNHFKKFFSYLSRILFLVILFQLISWFIIAPDPRFVYGPLLCIIFAILFLIFSSGLAQGYLIKRLVKVTMILTTIFIFFYSWRKIDMDPNYRNWLSPKVLPAPPVRKILLGAIELNIPEKILDNWNPRCYGVELPCLYQIDPRLQPRGKTIMDGFRIKKQNTQIPFTEY